MASTTSGLRAGVRGGARGGQLQALEDAAGDMGIRDGRQHSHSTATGRTAKGVDLEDPLQEIGPGHAARRRIQRIDAG